MQKIVVSTLLLSLFSVAHADSNLLYQRLTHPNFNYRYKAEVGSRSDFANKKIQDKITLGLRVNLDGTMQIISYAMSGKDYRSAYSDNPIKDLAVRQLYVKTKVNDDLYLDVGAMNPTTGHSMTGLSNLGWIDGVRATAIMSTGDKIEIVAGHLGSNTDTSITERTDFKFNYYQIKFSGRVLENLLYEVGLEKIDDQNYIRLQGKKSLEVLTGQLVRILGEAMVNLNNGGTKIGAEVQFALGKVFNNQSSVIAFVQVIHTDSNFGIHNNYVREDYLTGEMGAKMEVGIKGKIKGNLYWKLSYATSLESRNEEVRVGLEWKFGGPRLRR